MVAKVEMEGLPKPSLLRWERRTQKYSGWRCKDAMLLTLKPKDMTKRQALRQLPQSRGPVGTISPLETPKGAALLISWL